MENAIRLPAITGSLPSEQGNVFSACLHVWVVSPTVICSCEYIASVRVTAPLGGGNLSTNGNSTTIGSGTEMHNLQWLPTFISNTPEAVGCRNEKLAGCLANRESWLLTP